MKKTNVTRMHVASRLLKIVPVLLCIFLLSSSNLAAQDFLPLDEAITVVKTTAKEMPADKKSTSTSTLDQQSIEESLQRVFYVEFLNQAKIALSTEDAYNNLEDKLHVNKLSEPRRTYVGNALQDLMDLITE